jgi:dienelactone hydrolase
VNSEKHSRLEDESTSHKAMTVKHVTTPSGISFGMLGEKGAAPAPTVVVIASSIEPTLTSPDYANRWEMLAQKGYICVALDLPCHGADGRPGEPSKLQGWRRRLDTNENFVAPFVKSASAMIDHLIQEGYTDPKRIAIGGTSRGGWIGLHLAAAESRVQAIAAFAPVTDLTVLAEFNGLQHHPLTQSLAAIHLADKLAGRAIWMCIGNNDQRVGTDKCIAFARKVAAVAIADGKPAPIEIHVMQTDGHGTHKTAYAEATAWIERELRESR